MSKIFAFLTTFKYWLLALAILVPLSYIKGCADGSERVHAKYAKQSQEVAEAARKAGETAAAGKAARDETSIKQNEELRNEIKTPSNEPVGANTRRVLDGLRRQQTGSGETSR